MCRGGKDACATRRCEVGPQQKATANLRKKIKYRADKEGVPVKEWQEVHHGLVAELITKTLPLPPAGAFQPVTETRRLAEDVPLDIKDHISQSEKHIAGTLTVEQKLAVSGYTGFAAGVTNIAINEKKIEDDALYDLAPPWRETESGPTDFSTREDLEDYLNVLDTALSERGEKQRIIYRGLPIHRALHAELEEVAGKKIHVTDTEALLAAFGEYYKPGKVMEFPAYTSTTHSAYYAARRSENSSGTNISAYDSPEVRGLVLEMKTNAGLDVTGNARHNSYEREVLLPRDTRFRVESVTLRPESYDTISGYDLKRSPTRLRHDTYRQLAVVVQLVEVDENGDEITHTRPHSPSPLNLS